MPALSRYAVLALLMFTSTAAAEAQGLDAARERVAWAVQAEPATAAPGDTVRLVLRADIDAGWKMYAMDSPLPTRGVRPELVALPEGISHRPATFSQSEPAERHDPFFETNVRYFEDEATMRTSVTVAAEALPGERTIDGVVEFMVCNPQQCLPPAQEPFAATLTVTPRKKAPVGEAEH